MAIDAEPFVPFVGEHLPVRGTNTAYGSSKAEGNVSVGMDKSYLSIVLVEVLTPDLVEVE